MAHDSVAGRYVAIAGFFLADSMQSFGPMSQVNDANRPALFDQTPLEKNGLLCRVRVITER